MMDIMGACHSLTRVQGQLIGDPLELKLLETTGLYLEDNTRDQFDDLVVASLKADNYPTIGILRRFEFSSTLQRMSVVVRELSKPHLRLFVKGSPEKLRELCEASSIPSDFHQVLEHYAQNGYRVLAGAYRDIKLSYVNLHKVTRDALENKLTFVGFIIMANKLKQETTPVIR